ncbi:hypothetical protein V8C86DRAFT_2956143 [Haematococcus lacustris]
MDSTSSPAALRANLAEYRQQLKQVEELLLLEENVNEELQEMYNSLTEVIQLTEDLLRDAGDSAPSTSQQAGQQSHAAPAAHASGPAASSQPVIVTPPQLNLPSILPASVADQIRKAQVRAALTGQAPLAWAIGSPVTAQYSADGQWYNARVEGVTAAGLLVVAYEGYAEHEEVPLSAVKERAESEEVYRGVSAPKRKRVEDTPMVVEIPKWLEIKEGDDEKTKQKKRKLLKSYKSKIRFQNMDQKTKSKQDNWQNFITGKGSKPKAGFFTGRKKESQFAVPEGLNAKVGVVGSGKGMTHYQKAKRIDGMPDDAAADA